MAERLNLSAPLRRPTFGSQSGRKWSGGALVCCVRPTKFSLGHTKTPTATSTCSAIQGLSRVFVLHRLMMTKGITRVELSGLTFLKSRDLVSHLTSSGDFSQDDTELTRSPPQIIISDGLRLKNNFLCELRVGFHTKSFPV